MISRLHGTLVEIDLTEVVVDCGGVGYAVTIPMSTYDRLPPANSAATLLIHTSVREDAIQLFGFGTAAERQLFRLLLAVSGIGPRLALNVLSALPVEQFCEAVAAQDVKSLSRISGVGKRVAERLTIELRDRIEAVSPAAALEGSATATTLSAEAQDAAAALETLGFKHDQAKKAVEKVRAQEQGADASAEQLIRLALQILNS